MVEFRDIIFDNQTVIGYARDTCYPDWYMFMVNRECPNKDLVIEPKGYSSDVKGGIIKLIRYHNDEMTIQGFNTVVAWY